METVRLESVPPGAEAKTTNEQSCRTPCALALPANGTMMVTFTLNGYEPAMQKIEPAAVGSESPSLQPNPVVAELVPIPPPPKPAKPAKKKPVAKKPAAKPVAKRPAPQPATASASAPPPMMATPAQQQQAPWPGSPQPTR